jgi:hypothetical protein
LRLVDAAARRTPDASRLGALVAAEALLHETPDIQARALTIIERHADGADPELASALAAVVPIVAPSLRSRLAPLVVHDAMRERDPNDRRPRLAKLTVASSEWPDSMLDATMLDPIQPVAPIETTGELAVAVARALEHPEEIDNVERAISGISRLCGVSNTESASIWAPMRRRSERHLRDHAAFDGRGLATDFAALVAAWLDRKRPPRINPPSTVMGFLSVRMHAIARRAAAGAARPLLSAPTHAAGWIDPAALVARVGVETEPSDAADLVLALLRLAPDRRQPALVDAMELRGETAAALRFALGSDREKPGSTREVWVAAMRARCPGRDAPDLGRAFHKLGAGATNVVRPRVQVDRQDSGKYVWHHLLVSPDIAGRPPSLFFPTVVMHARDPKRNSYGTEWLWWGAEGCGSGAETEADVRWCATLLPADLDPYFL